MNLQLTPSMTFPAMTQVLSENLPDYKVELKKNSVIGFEYIQVKKTGWVGTWIRVFPKKNRVMLIKAIPSNVNRALLGGLISYMLVSGKQSKLRNEIEDILTKAFNTNVQA